MVTNLNVLKAKTIKIPLSLHIRSEGSECHISDLQSSVTKPCGTSTNEQETYRTPRRTVS